MHTRGENVRPREVHRNISALGAGYREQDGNYSRRGWRDMERWILLTFKRLFLRCSRYGGKATLRLMGTPEADAKLMKNMYKILDVG